MATRGDDNGEYLNSYKFLPAARQIHEAEGKEVNLVVDRLLADRKVTQEDERLAAGLAKLPAGHTAPARLSA